MRKVLTFIAIYVGLALLLAVVYGLMSLIGYLASLYPTGFGITLMASLLAVVAYLMTTAIPKGDD